jgi:UDP-N-acetylglucosamine 3-dehydrogenase
MTKLKYGVIGLGFFGEKHLEVLTALPDVEVIGICTRRERRLDELAKRFGVPKTFANYNDLLADEDIQAVSIVTHVESHKEPTVAALKAGKHVLLEKPMAPTPEECDEIIEEVKRAKAIFMVGHICRFDPRYGICRRNIEEGKIGKPVSLYARRNIPASVSESVLTKIGPLLGDGIHDTDLMLWYTGEKVKSVYAKTLSTRNLPNPDIGWAMLQFESGAIGVIEAVWYLPDKTPFDIDSRMEIIGTKGAIYIGGSDQGIAINDANGWKMPDTYYWPRVHGHRVGVLKDELSYFVRCAISGKQPEIITPEESKEAVRVMVAAEESAKSGKAVVLS